MPLWRRKRRGVYFTPKKYAELMTRAALSERLAGATYAGVLKINIVDPACGGGVFLVAAYGALLAAAERALRKPLSRDQKLEVLRACVFGADRDAEALDVSANALSAAAGDTRAAALLRNNLLRGDTLTDDLFADAAFDAVLANPPYVFGEQLSRHDARRLRSRYPACGEQIDLYAAFLELAVTRLCRPGGAYAFIVPDAVLARAQRGPVRRMLLDVAPPHTVAHAGAVFARNGAAVSAAILIGKRDGNADALRVVDETAGGRWNTVNVIPLSRVRRDEQQRFLIYVRPEEWPIFDALREAPRLGSLLRKTANAKGISRGEETGKRALRELRKPESGVAVIAGDAISPYALAPKRYFLAALEKDRACYAAPKILVRKTDGRLFACAEYDGTATLQSVYNLQVEPEWFHCVLAVLNSRFARWFLKRTVTQYKKLMPQITQAELLSIPVPCGRRDYSQLVRDAAAGNGALARIESAILEDLGLGAYGHLIAP